LQLHQLLELVVEQSFLAELMQQALYLAINVNHGFSPQTGKVSKGPVPNSLTVSTHGKRDFVDRARILL